MKTLVLDVFGMGAQRAVRRRTWHANVAGRTASKVWAGYTLGGGGQKRVEGLLTHRFPLDDDHRAFVAAADKAKYRSMKVALGVGTQESGIGYRGAGLPAA